MRCRNCGFYEIDVEGGLGFIPEVDLGRQPPANYLHGTEWGAKTSPTFPLRAVRCPACSLVQLTQTLPDLFTPDYPYRQGQSQIWRRHLEGIVLDCIKVKGHGARTLDVGSNDGTLVAMMGQAVMDAWGIDPAPVGFERTTVAASMGRDNPLRWGKPFDYVTALNVLAHVPDLDDFLAGIKGVLAQDGLLVIEVPDWEKSTWTAVYHEHLSYFTSETLANVLGRRGFVPARPFELVDTHEGSWRATVVHA